MELGLGVERGVHVVGVVDRHRGDAIAAGVEKRLHAALLLLGRPGEQEGMAKERQFLAARVERGPDGRLALDDVVGVGLERDVVDVDVRVGVVAQRRAGIEPDVEHLSQSSRANLGLGPRVDKADHRNLLVPERRHEPLGHRTNIGEPARPAVTAAGQIVDGDCDSAGSRSWRLEHGEGEQREGEMLHCVTLPSWSQKRITMKP